MIEWLTNIQLVVAAAAGVINLLLGLIGKLPSDFKLALVGLVELGLLAQLIATIVLLAQGESPAQNVFEFFGYLLVAMLLPIGGAFWAIVERNRYSTIVLGLVPLVICVMLYRMTQLWY